MPAPAGVNFPEGNPTWAGAAAGAPAGETANVTFDALSAHTDDFKTVIAQCGDSETMAQVVVIEPAELVVTEAIAGADDTYYIGREQNEYIYMTVTLNPAIPDVGAIPQDFLVWQGDGEQVNTLQRRIAKNISGVYEAGASRDDWNATATVKVLEIMLVYVDGALEGYMEFGSWYAPVEAEGTVEVQMITNSIVNERELPEEMVV